jgi:hypothetical protein
MFVIKLLCYFLFFFTSPYQFLKANKRHHEIDISSCIVMEVISIEAIVHNVMNSHNDWEIRVPWNTISRDYVLPESFMRDFGNYLNWDHISKRQDLTVDFMREFQNCLNWDHISRYQELSEGFIREFRDLVNWTLDIGHWTLDIGHWTLDI